MIDKVKVIAFDADDTLWANENFFRNTEKIFIDLLKDYGSEEFLAEELYQTEINNIELYGYGVKAFILSLVEVALKVSSQKLDPKIINQIIQLGKDMLNEDVELLEDVKEVLHKLSSHYRLVVATKGDLLDQERKLQKSGIAQFFHHVEVMSNKKELNYQSLLKHLDINPEQFLMIGNSLRSDILPVLNLGGYAVHVPYHTTWQHEVVHEDELPISDKFFELEHLQDVLKYFNL